MLMDWLKKAPTAVVVAMIIMCGVVACGVLTAYVILTINDQDTTEFRQWINTVGQILVFPLLGTTAIASVAGARSASKAEDNTNGTLTALQNEVRGLRQRLDGQGGDAP
jgi:predicted permease